MRVLRGISARGGVRGGSSSSGSLSSRWPLWMSVPHPAARCLRRPAKVKQATLLVQPRVARGERVEEGEASCNGRRAVFAYPEALGGWLCFTLCGCCCLVKAWNVSINQSIIIIIIMRVVKAWRLRGLIEHPCPRCAGCAHV